MPMHNLPIRGDMLRLTLESVAADLDAISARIEKLEARETPMPFEADTMSHEDTPPASDEEIVALREFAGLARFHTSRLGGIKITDGTDAADEWLAALDRAAPEKEESK
jgi:hypothetical protein